VNYERVSDGVRLCTVQSERGVAVLVEISGVAGGISGVKVVNISQISGVVVRVSIDSVDVVTASVPMRSMRSHVGDISISMDVDGTNNAVNSS